MTAIGHRNPTKSKQDDLQAYEDCERIAAKVAAIAKLLETQIAGRLVNWLLRQLVARVAGQRPPDFVVGAEDPKGAYLRRWYLIPRNRFLCIYLHHFLRDDDDRALHDHPWAWASLLLRGRYIEHTIDAGGVHHKRERKAGSWKFSLPSRAHRIELLPVATEHGQEGWRQPCWTLFITGPRVREWGFHCPEQGWIHFKRFTKPGSVGERGPGCEG